MEQKIKELIAQYRDTTEQHNQEIDTMRPFIKANPKTDWKRQAYERRTLILETRIHLYQEIIAGLAAILEGK